MQHEIINHEDGTRTYRDIQFQLHKGRYMVVSNVDLLDLGHFGQHSSRIIQIYRMGEIVYQQLEDHFKEILGVYQESIS